MRRIYGLVERSRQILCFDKFVKSGVVWVRMPPPPALRLDRALLDKRYVSMSSFDLLHGAGPKTLDFAQEA